MPSSVAMHGTARTKHTPPVLTLTVDRPCAHCGGPLPPQTQGTLRLTCSNRCRSAVSRERQATVLTAVARARAHGDTLTERQARAIALRRARLGFEGNLDEVREHLDDFDAELGSMARAWRNRNRTDNEVAAVLLARDLDAAARTYAEAMHDFRLWLERRAVNQIPAVATEPAVPKPSRRRPDPAPHLRLPSGRGRLRAQILDLLADGRPYTVDDVLSRITVKSRESLSVTLASLSRRGFLTRAGRGTYSVPASVHHQETP